MVLLNINGYWDEVLAWACPAVKQGFISGENGTILKDMWPRLVEYLMQLSSVPTELGSGVIRLHISRLGYNTTD